MPVPREEHPALSLAEQTNSQPQATDTATLTPTPSPGGEAEGRPPRNEGQDS